MQPFPRALIDRSRVIVDANIALEVWASRPTGTLVGMPLADVLGVDDDELAAALATGNPGGIRLASTTHGYQETRSSVVIRAVRISGGHTIVAFDPELAAVGDQTRALGRRESERLQLLLSASVAFANTRSEEELGELLSETARRAFNANACSVHTGEAGNYALVAGENLLAADWPDDAPPRAGSTVQLGHVVTIETPDEADTVVPGIGLGDIFRRAGVYSVIGAPIIEDGTPFGAFACYFDQPRTFDDQAVPLAEALAQLAGQVLVRLRLEARLRRAAMLDEVTGLPNRRLFDENLQQTQRARRSDRRALRRPRRVQGRQRHPRARHGRRRAQGSRRAADPRLPPGGLDRPLRRRRVHRRLARRGHDRRDRTRRPGSSSHRRDRSTAFHRDWTSPRASASRSRTLTSPDSRSTTSSGWRTRRCTPRNGAAATARSSSTLANAPAEGTHISDRSYRSTCRVGQRLRLPTMLAVFGSPR